MTHADEGFVSAALRLSAPLDEAALLALLDGAGPGLCRAKGVVDLRLDGGVTVPATVQYAAGRLGFEPARKARSAIWCSSARIFPCRKRRLRKGGACGADRTGRLDDVAAVGRLGGGAGDCRRADAGVHGMSVPGLPFSRPRAGGDAHGRRAASGGPAGGRPLLRDFAALLGSPLPNREAALRLAGRRCWNGWKRGFPCCPCWRGWPLLMGLLGTILGMITTFAHRRGPLRRGHVPARRGIWQALLTTAAGLCIAIPALFFLSCFQGKVRRVADALNKAGNAALLADGGPGITVRAGAEPLQPGDIPRGAARRKGPLARNRRNLAAALRRAGKPLQCRDNAGEGLPDGGRSC